MIRVGIFFSVVSALYMIGQKEQAVSHPTPAAIPMTLTLDGTRISAPKHLETDWQSDKPRHDGVPMPAGFKAGAAKFTLATGFAAVSSAD